MLNLFCYTDGEEKMKYSGIGGQAVIEGIMMRNGKKYATAVRKPDGDIAVQVDTYESVSGKCPVFRWPFQQVSLKMMKTVSRQRSKNFWIECLERRRRVPL